MGAFLPGWSHWAGTTCAVWVPDPITGAADSGVGPTHAGLWGAAAAGTQAVPSGPVAIAIAIVTAVAVVGAAVFRLGGAARRSPSVWAVRVAAEGLRIVHSRV